MLLRILLLFLLTFAINAQDAKQVIQKLQNKFSTIDNLTSEFSQAIVSNQNTQTIQLEGKFSFKKENSFSIKLPTREIISNGVSVWNYDETQRKVVISNYDSENSNFSLNEIIYKYPEKCKLTLVQKSKNYIIKAIPEESLLSFKEAFLTIDKDYLLNKVEIIDFNNVKYIFQLTNIKLNEKLGDNQFEFIPSDEVEVIDLR